MRIRNGFADFSANSDVDRVASASPVAAEVLMKLRRVVVFMVGDYERRFIVSINEQHDATPRDQIDWRNRRRSRPADSYNTRSGDVRIISDADARDSSLRRE